MSYQPVYNDYQIAFEKMKEILNIAYNKLYFDLVVLLNFKNSQWFYNRIEKSVEFAEVIPAFNEESFKYLVKAFAGKGTLASLYYILWAFYGKQSKIEIKESKNFYIQGAGWIGITVEGASNSFTKFLRDLNFTPSERVLAIKDELISIESSLLKYPSSLGSGVRLRKAEDESGKYLRYLESFGFFYNQSDKEFFKGFLPAGVFLKSLKINGQNY
ncbi:MAG: hypothetical protein ACRCYP_05290 [Alphaproteobacteria bacterium]